MTLTKWLLFAMIISYAAALLYNLLPCFMLGSLFLIFAGLEAFQTKYEKDLTIWKKEVEERRVDDIESWHRADYENMDEFNNN